MVVDEVATTIGSLVSFSFLPNSNSSFQLLENHRPCPVLERDEKEHNKCKQAPFIGEEEEHAVKERDGEMR